MSVERKSVVLAIVDGLCAQGWSVTIAGGHYRCVPPESGGSVVFLASTPSDCRAVKNMIGVLRRSGADVSKLPKG